MVHTMWVHVGGSQHFWGRWSATRLGWGVADPLETRPLPCVSQWLMLGTVSQTMLYYLKQLTLLNHDLIDFGNIKI